MIKSLGMNIWGYDLDLKKIYRIKDREKVYYQIAEVIGEGHFSKVHILQPEKNNLKSKAIKIAKNSTIELNHEFNILSSLEENHEGIQKSPKAYGPCMEGINSFMIMPKYDGTLFDLFLVSVTTSVGISEKKINGMTSEMIKDAIGQLLAGLDYLHKKGIFLDDIKLNNILFRKKDDKFEYHLADFGISKAKTATVENDFDKISTIESLGKVFKEIIFQWRAFVMGQISEKDILQKNLPSPLAHLINFMTGNEKQLGNLSERDSQVIRDYFYHHC